MIELSREMKEYEKVCATFRAAHIKYEEIDTKGYTVTFMLTKDGASCKAIIDCSSENVAQHTLNAVASLERLAEWNRKEQEKQNKKSSKRG
jgi:hypothetical protein